MLLSFFRHFGSVERTQALQEISFPRLLVPELSKRFVGPPVSKERRATSFSLNEIRVSVSVAAAVAVTGAGHGGGGYHGSANVGVAHGSAHLVDFINSEFPRSETGKYSVVFLSRHLFSPFYLLLHSLAQLLRFTDKTCLRLSCL
jgi:hypothetical protein